MPPDEIIAHIAALQTTGSPHFNAGLFPSYRVQPQWFGYRRADDNVFLTACATFTLQGIRDRVSPEGQLLIDQMTQQAAKAYPLFQNKDGLELAASGPSLVTTTFII